MITKEVEVENLRDGNIILIGAQVGEGTKVRVNRVRKYDDGICDLYEVLFTMIEHPLRKMDQIVYAKGYKMTLVF